MLRSFRICVLQLPATCCPVCSYTYKCEHKLHAVGSFEDKAFGCMCIADSCLLHLALQVVIAVCLPVLSELVCSDLIYFGFVEPSL